MRWVETTNRKKYQFDCEWVRRTERILFRAGVLDDGVVCWKY